MPDKPYNIRLLMAGLPKGPSHNYVCSRCGEDFVACRCDVAWVDCHVCGWSGPGQECGQCEPSNSPAPEENDDA